MTRTPLTNAVLAAGYIAAVASAMFYAPRVASGADPAFPIIPFVIISLFTLSAAVMAYLFLSQPVALYFSGDARGAAGLFLKTVGIFAVITLAMTAVLFLVIH